MVVKRVIVKRKERQGFGFAYEKAYCRKVGLKQNKNYTGKFDAEDKNGLSVQIKTYKKGCSLMMADPFRYLNITEPFDLVIACRDSSNKVIKEEKIKVNPEKLKSLFKEENFENRCNFMRFALSQVSNSHDDDKKWKEYLKEERKQRSGRILQVQGKRDHKNQKRVQWAIASKNINQFVEKIKY